MHKISLLIIFLSGLLIAQEVSWINLTINDNSILIPSYNYEGKVYISLSHLSKSLNLKYDSSNTGTFAEISFDQASLRFTARNPFVSLETDTSGEFKTIQLPVSSHFIDGQIFTPLDATIELFNKYGSASIFSISPGKLMVLEKEQLEINSINEIRVDDSEKGTYILINTSLKVKAQLIDEEKESFLLLIKNASTFNKDYSNLKPKGYVKHIGVNNISGNVEIRVKKNKYNIANEFFTRKDGEELVIHLFERDESYWLERESEHFKIIYRDYHSPLVNYILTSAEEVFKAVAPLFNYKPENKIIINTYDVNDYGFGATSTTPQNFIRLEIEPLEPGYEIIPHTERLKWLIGHELVHVIVNDAETGMESFFRDVFGKVPPEKSQPLSVFYSLLTNYNRYSPRWHQESIAVFFETWLSGGFGRILGSFDEMFFRTLVYEQKKFPSQLDLETIESHTSIYLENIFYTYGGRFVAYLSIFYGTPKVLDWFKTNEGDAYSGFEGKFKKVFNKNFDEAWDKFMDFETEFQKSNIEILNQSDQTNLRNISSEQFGWVTRPYLDRKTNSIIYGYHRSHQLATLQSLNLSSGLSEELSSLPTPSMIQVSSLAFDEVNGLLFYTTKNNQLYRDIWILDIETSDKKNLFQNARVGDLTVSPVTHDLWGIRHDAGFVSLVFSPFPYEEIISILTLELGDEIFNLSIEESGQRLSAILKRSNGQQSLIAFETDDLLNNLNLKYQIISSSGSPENPSWSKDGRFLYWNAYTNGVSNIYKYDFSSSSITAISHCITGLFRPLEITPDSIFAFKYSFDGFIPVMFENKSAEFLPAINYLGQKVLDENPELYTWNISRDSSDVDPVEFETEEGYNGLKNLHVHSIIPVVTGFQSQVVFGLFTRISDPLLNHDFYMEAGISPLSEKPSYPDVHLRFKYDYKQMFYVEFLYNGQDFFDLFNNRKRGTIGQQLKLGHTYYWKYDNPNKIKQATTLTIYRDYEFINDNLVRVSQPDFAILATNLNFKNYRKSIGSSDYEQGNEINWTLGLYGTKFESPEVAVNTYAEVSNLTKWLWSHNVFHVKVAGGYLWDNENLVQSRFYLGGFGNRPVDNDEIRQFRRIFRFPGIPIYSLDLTKFGKVMLENDFPPVRVSGLLLLDQFINHFDFSVYSQSMITNSDLGDYWVDIGAQFDIKLKHWYNLESTFSAGIAKAWSLPDGVNDWEWFLSLKLLKD